MWPKKVLLVPLLKEAYLVEEWDVISNKEKHNVI